MMFNNIDRVGMFPGIDSVYLIASPAMRAILVGGLAAGGMMIVMSYHRQLVRFITGTVVPR